MLQQGSGPANIPRLGVLRHRAFNILMSPLINWSVKRMVLPLVLLPIMSSFAEESGFESWVEVENALVGKSITRQWVPMRDGIRLDANIYLPARGEPPYPTVLIRTPYHLRTVMDWPIEIGLVATLLESGYVVVFQSERGRFWSEGESVYLAKARDDGYDTIDWLAKQDWSNGRVGTYGCSSHGSNQLSLSTASHPAHLAAIALSPGTGIGKIGPYWELGFYRGGALHLWAPRWFHDGVTYGKRGAKHRPQFPADLSQRDRQRISKYFELTPVMQRSEQLDYGEYIRYLPISNVNEVVQGPLTDWDDFSRRTPSDSAWEETDFVNEGDTFGVPMLWLFSWYDISVAPSIAMYNYARENTASETAEGNQFMIIGPMTHCQFGKETENTIVGERDLGDARYDYAQRFIEWFDYWLKGERNEALGHPKVEYYQMGRNQWVTSDEFPSKATKPVDLYLGSQGNANGLYGDGRLHFVPPDYGPENNSTVDNFTYDPKHPVPTLGGGFCCMGDKNVAGAFDQSDLEVRSDILVYTTEPLEEGLNVAGFVEAELYVASDAKDTDFTLKLIDVYPDGRAFNLDDTIFRARYREGFNEKVLMEEDKVYKIVFPPMVTGNYFRPGHRIRLEVSSSNFPHYDRNLNTGGDNYNESDPTVARNHVHHSVQYPSRIRLPVKEVR